MRILTLPLLLCLSSALPCLAQTAAQTARDADLDELRTQLDATREELQALREQLQELRPAQPALAPAVRFGNAPRPMLGIVMSNSSDHDGVLISAVTPGAPADKAGVRAGDQLVAVNGTQLTGPNASQLAYQVLADMKDGQAYDLSIDRNGERKNIAVIAELVEPALSFTFTAPKFDGAGQSYAFTWDNENQKIDLEEFREWAKRSRQFSTLFNSGQLFAPGRGPMANFAPMVWGVGLNWADLELAALNPGLGRYFGADSGVLVIDSQLADGALEAGDVIRKVDGQTVTEAPGVLRALRGFSAGDEVSFEVLRDGRELTVVVTTPASPTNGFFYQYESDDRDDP